MPVPTETLRSVRKLNILFAASSALLAVATFWLVWRDWQREWRGYQEEALVWQAAMTSDALDRSAGADLRQQISEKEQEIRRARLALPSAQLDEKNRQLTAKVQERGRRDLPLARAKAEIVPLEQQIERARLSKSPDLAKLNKRYTAIVADYNQKNADMVVLDREIVDLTQQRDELRKALDEQSKELENLIREKRALEDKLRVLEPKGLGIVGRELRNAPLLDWFNPSQKIEQNIVTGVRQDLNFITVETADACRTCHLHIDKPEFEEGEMIRFLQRQLARAQGQDVSNVEEAIVEVTFWENAAGKAAASSAATLTKYRALQQAALTRINALRASAGLKPVADGLVKQGSTAWTADDAAAASAALAGEMKRIAETSGDDSVSRRQWYEQRQLYVDDLHSLIQQEQGEAAYKAVRRLFRTHLIGQFNGELGELARRAKTEQRQGISVTSVSDNPVLLAHPRLDLYVEAESAHPLKTMACSVCHEGSGQDTSFFHTAHTPRHIWVDADSGAPVADFLLTGERGSEAELKREIRQRQKQQQSKPAAPQVAAGPVAGSIALAAASSEPRASASGASNAAAVPADRSLTVAAPTDASHDHAGHAELSQRDVNLLKPNDPAPYAPPAEDHQPARVYLDPANPGQPRIAIRQAAYWERKYHWHHVHYQDWEKPMHSMEFVESSCTKCHTGHYDLRKEGPKVFEGRRTFAQVGCANCHLVDGLATHQDVKKVGPSLVHIKDKLSPAMMGTWIWSPKAFRPTSRMPHFFMLENNSTPIDVLRTRVEVAAMTQYLLQAPPGDAMKLSQLMGEDAKLVAERTAETTLESRKAAIDTRRAAIKAEVEAIKKKGLPRYQPELPVAVQVKAWNVEADELKKQLTDAKTKAEDKPAIEKKLAEIDAKIKAAKPLTGDAARGRQLFLGSPGAQIADGGVGCVACHTNLNENGKQWIADDLAKRSDLNHGLWFVADLKRAGQSLGDEEAAKIAARLVEHAAEHAPALDKKVAEEIAVKVGKALKAELIAAAKKVDPPKDAPADLKTDEAKKAFAADQEAKRLAQATVAAAAVAQSAARLLGTETANAFTYNQQHSYILQHLSNKLNRRGPELSGVGTKLKAGRTDEQALTWLYDWLRNPAHFSSTTIMPSFRLTEQEAMDLAAYLLQQERPGVGGSTWSPVDFVAEAKGELQQQMIEALADKLGAEARARAEAMQRAKDRGEKEINSEELKALRVYHTGSKLIAHYNCQACHLINGFEETASSAPQLNEWGLKDPHKLDFGYFEEAESARRAHPAPVWKTAHEGLNADAATIGHNAKAGDIDPRLTERKLAWEEVENDRRPWLTQKLHNTRMFDRGRYLVEAELATLQPAALKDSAVKALRRGVDKAYDKLKMPKFFLTDVEAQQVITFVTSIRKPLVEPSLQKVADDLGAKATIGRQVAEKYNCYGCHNIEGNDVSIHAFFAAAGEAHLEATSPRLQLAPPRLTGQGAKTQPDWIVYFLQNVHKLRPTLKVRMPSFHLEEGDAIRIADYFAGATHQDGKRLSKLLAPIETQIEKNGKRKLELAQDKAALTERLAFINYALSPKTGKLADNLRKALSPADLSLVGKAEGGSLSAEEKKNLGDLQKSVERRLRQIEAQVAVIDRWSENPALAKAAPRLAQWIVDYGLLAPRQLDPRQNDANSRATAMNNSLTAAQFLRGMLQVEYPHPKPRLPQIDEERFKRGEALFATVLCVKCHPLGEDEKLAAIFKKDNPAGVAPPPAAPKKDDAEDFFEDAPKKPDAAKPDPAKPDAAKPGTKKDEDDPFGEEKPAEAPAPPAGPEGTAPNLRYAVHRLQPTWVNEWLQRSTTFLPGAAMPPQWAGPSPLDSFFFQYPDPVKGDNHKKFHFTGPEQRQLLLDYIYAAGMRNHTFGAWKLDPKGVDPVTVALTPVDPPKADEFKLPEFAATKPADAAVDVPVTPTVVKLVSDIKLHEGSAAYEGEPAHGNKTRLVGVVKFEGRRPGRAEIDMASDPFCVKAHQKESEAPQSEALIVTKDNTVQYAFVYVKSAVPGKFEPSKSPVLLDQVGCMYTPHVVGVQVGQAFVVRNSDATLHNVNIGGQSVRDNFGQPQPGMTKVIPFPKLELGIPFKCDVHKWMNATVHAVPHPFFAVSDVEGRFEIKGLPPGKHTLEVVHESARIAPVEIEVEVKADASQRVDVVVKPK